MLFQRITRVGPEKVFAICKNTDSVEILDGDCLVWSQSVSANWGSDILKSTVAASGAYAGVAATKGVSAGQGAAVGDFFTVQVYGYHGNVKTTTGALAAGTIVTVNTAADAVAASVAALANITDGRFGICLKLGASNRAGIFIRAMGQA